MFFLQKDSLDPIQTHRKGRKLEIERGNLKNLQKLISDLKLYRGKKHFKKREISRFFVLLRLLNKSHFS
ncbi:hypothetical protein BTA37_20460 [Priestia megaterium]|nr:hypothetical protein BTA37_20460 [Priestia megaterium]